VLAQRTALQVLKEEDDRYHGERQASFEFWSDYCSRTRERLREAVEKGQPVSEFLPHPSDVVLDWVNLEVCFLGAADEEERIHEKRIELIRDLSFELSVYFDEDNQLPGKDDRDGRIGPFLLLHVAACRVLPPRLRALSDEFMNSIKARAVRGRCDWGRELERRCRVAGLPFPRHRKSAMPTISLAKLKAKGQSRTSQVG